MIYESEASITHPSRLLICGKSGSGKTTLAIHLILNLLMNQIDRLIVVCPTWSTQDAFRALDAHVNKKRDVFEQVNNNTFIIIFKQLIKQNKIAKEYGLPRVKTLLFVDDCGSTQAIHGGRISKFGHLSIQLRHLGVSSIVLVQNPKLASPNYRENCTGFIFFPTQRKDELEWINNEFNGTMGSKDLFFRLIAYAWSGGNEDQKENEPHFLFINQPPRGKIRFYCDFDKELCIDEIK